MKSEIRQQITDVLEDLRKILISNEVSIEFDQDTDSLIFLLTAEYLDYDISDGFDVKLKDLVERKPIEVQELKNEDVLITEDMIQALHDWQIKNGIKLNKSY